MRPTAIKVLYDELPQVFIHQRQKLPDGIILRDGTIGGSEITTVEETLLPEETSNTLYPDIRPESFEPRLNPDRIRSRAADDLRGSHDETGQLRSPWNKPIDGDPFPGAPQPFDPQRLPPIDALAFYLPYHRFVPGCYGIYIFADGMKFLAQVLYEAGRGLLSPIEALTLGKAFLFHHEAYHNAVEVFATRLELAHRRPVYEAGVMAWYKAAIGHEHEEALATGYAISAAVKSVKAPKRKIAKLTLEKFTRILAPPYRDGVNVVRADAHSLSERILQEQSCTRSIRGLPSLDAAIWQAGPHLMHPSLSRGRSFSYVIAKESALASRLPLDAIYFADRRKLLKKLKEHLGGGQEEAGGKHPIFRAPNGKRVPIPYSKDVDEGTLGSILDSLGIDMRPRDFMRLQRY